MADRKDCLKRRMLNAAVETYHPDLRPRLGGEPGWIGDPVALTRRDAAAPPGLRLASRRDIDLALVGRVSEGILIAIRGTLPPVDLVGDSILPRREAPGDILADWANSGALELRTDFPVGALRLPGAVHAGFADSAASLWGEAGGGVRAAIDRLLAAGAPHRLYFSGHSKGGAVANLAAYCARRTWDVPVKVLTVGAPRPGNRGFAEAYRSAGIACLRYEVANDPVPGILKQGPVRGRTGPLDDYVAVGDAAPVPGAPGLFGRVLGGFRGLRAVVPTPIAAHIPYPGFRYDDYVCDPATCRHDWR
jgi:hypothetical protein